MRPIEEFRNQPSEFWALVKWISQQLKYSERGTQRLKRYDSGQIVSALKGAGLDPSGHEEMIDSAARYSAARASLLESEAEKNLMNRDQAADEFAILRARIDPPEYLLPMNKQKKEKRHYAYLTCMVNMLTYEILEARNDGATFEHNPRSPLTFARGGMPQRTLFRWMDGAYPDVNHPIAAWEIKEYYGSKTFGSRIADGVYESALDGYELNELREEGIEVGHYLFIDDHHTWWGQGRPYLCRIVDMLHVGLLDEAFCGREVLTEWPRIVKAWK